MRGAVGVAGAVLGLALALGLVMVDDDIRDEVDAGMQLAQTMAVLAQSGAQPAERVLGELRRLQQGGELRHVRLEIVDNTGRPLLTGGATQTDGWLDGLLGLHRRLLDEADPRVQEWSMARPDGPPWRVRLSPSHDAERREAVANLLGMLAVLLICIVGLLVSMRWNLRRAFVPLHQLLRALEAIGRDEPAALKGLPTMPVQELELMAQATRRLAGDLAATQRQRRELSRKMLDLQEAERARLAHELHDELAQGLTALRVRAAWLRRRHDQGALSRDDLGPIESACEQMQREVRALLVGLRPFGGPQQSGGRTTLARLVSLLQAMVMRWNDGPLVPAPRMQVRLTCTDAQDRPREWPQGAQAEALHLPEPVAQVIYRISQESLTNAARHAGARHAVVGLHLRLDAIGGMGSIAWEGSDDGMGIEDFDAAMRRGNGLAGINQRVWAVGADLTVASLEPGAKCPGLRLAAWFDLSHEPSAACPALAPGLPQVGAVRYG